MKEFLTKYKRAFLLSLIFSMLCFGFMLTHFTITIDEETWLLANQPSLLWLLQGRFAVWLFDLIFTNEGNFAPFLWDFLSVVIWHFSGVILAYALLAREKVKEWQMFFFWSYYSSLPFVVGEILSFSMFNLQVCTAMAATAGAFLFTLRFLEGKKKKDLGLAFGLLLYGVAVYQALLCVYVTGVVAFCLLKFITGEEKGLVRVIVSSALICIAAVVVYYGIDMIIWHFSGTAAYLEDNYIGWASDDWKMAAALSVANIGRVSFAIPYDGVYIYGGGVIRCVTILFILYALWIFLHSKGAKQKLGIFFYTAALCAAPFSLYIAIATYKTHGRMLLAIPLAGAVQLYLIFREMDRLAVRQTGRKLRTVMIVLASYLLFLNARNMNLIYYYGSIAYERDCTTANQVMYDIKKAGMDYHEKPIAFVGMVEQDSLPIQESDTLGGSVFNWDEGNISRMKDFLRTKGYAVLMPSPEQISRAAKESETMNTWPQEGSIRELDDMIVVYFAEPAEEWYGVNHAEK